MQSLLFLSAGVLAILVVFACLAGLFLLYQIIKQQGRVLMSLDSIEERLALLAPAPKAAPAPGLPVGNSFPSFSLPDLDGRDVALEDYLGKRVLMVNWSFSCGFCARIAPELAKLKDAFRAHNVQLALISTGTAEANSKAAREHGLERSVLLLQDSQGLPPFQSLGTPVAYLLDAKGRVAMALAVGADRVPLLARYAVGEATEAELGSSASVKQGTCGQAAQGAPEIAETRELVGVGPGTELKKMLARLRIAVTPDCPCNERAALMDRNGWAWCEGNVGTIVGWMQEEATRRGTVFIEFGARFLVKRAIAKARRSDGKATRTTSGIIAAQERTS